MSHAYGQVKFEDGTILHFEYNGTVDVAMTQLFDSREGVKEHWRESLRYVECNCGNDEPVELATDYGSGKSWNGRACRHCMAITGGFEPYPYFRKDDYIPPNRGLPNWWLSLNLD